MTDVIKTATNYLKQGSYQLAKDAFRAILEKTPRDKKALHGLALVYITEKKYTQAYQLLEKAIEQDQQDPKLWYDLGNVARILKNLPDAALFYGKALTQSPQFAEAIAGLATVYELQFDYEKAVNTYNRALSLDPIQPETQYNLGRLLLKKGELENAAQCFLHVIQLCPEHSQAYFHLGLIAYQQEAWSVAENYFKTVLDLIPHDIESLNNMGVIALKQGEAQLAVHYFGKALAEKPEHIEARENIAAVFMQENRFDNAITHYETLLHYMPNHYQGQFNLACAHMTIGHFEKATMLFSILEKIIPDNADVLANLGLIAQQQRQYAIARSYFEKVLMQQPDNQIIRHMLSALNQSFKEKVPDEYVRHLFDHYAFYYDKHLRESLKYSVPDKIQQLCKEKSFHFKHVLDLGCGTGLVAEKLTPFVKKIEGVDLSEKMIELARRKDCYQTLSVNTIENFLERTNPESYDGIIAADVLNYIGALHNLFKQIETALMENGLFIFTIELDKTCELYQLKETGRFVYSEHYIQNCIAQLKHLDCIHHEKITLRQQEKEAVTGLLFVVSKTPTEPHN